ncbi:MAG: 4-deoxy-4-formamido-L-arabinose-phosphoundecaprenol deformylase [Comamonadaceae bacterium]|nr:4-deoxy-4-formamido-L-arabinose-phosphoundecaprenol deformylase [Rubrivivax sp.]NLZ42417.1 4-deoxy-4-formamido-L-arabinose-phosphoundecaprenol deformylase [Comamonadaceae bacterium]
MVLKVDVDTWRGTREGVPLLAALLERRHAQATFLFSLGPDHTGRAVRRALRPGFAQKVARTSVLEHYGLRTLLYGTLLPGPDIGRREAATLRAVAAAGFECGVHCWDHVRWQDGVARAGAAWTNAEMDRACGRFGEVFGRAPALHGAAGWQMNEHAFAAELRCGFELASDCRGRTPFLPVDAAGRTIGPPQWPTTLPTFDELLGRDGCDPGNVERAVLAACAQRAGPQVYTLHAELEGGKLRPAFERLLGAWAAEGRRCVGLLQAQAAHAATLPRCTVVAGSVPGRSGMLALQGPAPG